MDGLKKYIIKNKLHYFLLFLIIAFISYGNLLSMYFFHDDYANLYHAQNKILFEFPYQMMIVILRPLYLLFGLNPLSYHFLAILLYSLASMLLFYFFQMSIKNHSASLFLSSLFAAGYIGQNSMKMFLADGLVSLVGIIFLIITLVSVFAFLHKRRGKYYMLALVSLFITYEIAPHRLLGAVLIVAAADFIFSINKNKHKKLVLRLISYFAIFVIQYSIHPSKWVLGYETAFDKQVIIKANHFPYMLGILGNLFIPHTEFLRANIYSQTTLYPRQILQYIAPVLLLFLLTTFFIYTIKPKNKRRRIKASRTPILLFEFGIAFFVASTSLPVIEQLSIIYGSIILVEILYLLFINYPSNPKIVYLSLITTLSILILFPLVGSDYSLPAYQRYLLPSSLIPPLLLTALVSKEMTSKNKYKKIIAWCIFAIPVTAIILSHLHLAQKTQRQYANTYSQHAKIFYKSLLENIEEINGKTILYIDYSNSKYKPYVDDALRVGRYKSEYAIAVHYKTNPDNIVLITDPDQLKEVDKNAAKLYEFAYDKNGLQKID